jgi:4-hydroxy 2-oxovalerate aldolase
VYLLDTTLRDGSYIVNFSFSLDDTYELCFFLDQSGIDFIEIGHGLGIGKGKGKDTPLPYPEVEYFIAAKKAIKNAKWGVFFIPGIGDFEDIDSLVEYGASFIRIGVDSTNIDKGIEYIKYAKDKGLIVFLNLMKTYSISPNNLSNVLKDKKYLEDYIDVLCIVDSSGGMVNKNIQEYIDAIRKVFKHIEIGFHGHNNLDMANSNSLYALENGVNVIDVSLGGLGRSAGNTISESFVLLLNKLNITKKYNYRLLMELSENMINPYIKNVEKNKISYISGFADFHSSLYLKISHFSKVYNIEEIDLIIEISNVGSNDLTDDLLIEKAKELSYLNNKENHAFTIQTHAKVNEIQDLYKKVVIKSKKNSKLSFINFVKTDNLRMTGLIHMNEDAIFTSVSYSTTEELKLFTEDIPTGINFLYISTNNLSEQKLLIELFNKKVIFYNDDKFKIYSILSYMKNLFFQNEIVKLEISGSNFLSEQFRHEINKIENYIIVSESADILILFETINDNDAILNYKYVLDTNIGLVDLNKLTKCDDYKYNVYRVDMIDMIPKFAVLDYRRFKEIDKCLKVEENKTFVSSGLVGKNGDIVVDNVENPKLVHGVADGKGFLTTLIDENNI